MTIEIKKKAYFQVDGEYLGITRKVTAQIEKQALRLLYPIAYEEETANQQISEATF